MKISDTTQGKTVIIPDVPNWQVAPYGEFEGYPFGNKAYTLLYIYPCILYTNIAVCLEGVVRSFNVPSDLEVQIPSSEETELALKELGEAIYPTMQNSLQHYFSIGADPEIFAETAKGEVLPAFSFLGSKEKPTQVEDVGFGKNNAYWDGFQAEFDTYAQSCLAYLTDSIQNGLRGVKEAMKAKDPTAVLSNKTVMRIPDELLRTSAEEHVQFGCNPSFNVYKLKGRIADGRTAPFRSAGGHLHFGTGNLDDVSVERIVKSLDAIVAVACVSLFASIDDSMRREMYGLAGEYRKPPHGIEYRTLSNAWMFHPLTTHLVFGLSRCVVMMGLFGLNNRWKTTEDETIEIIQTCNVDKAREVLKRNEELFKKLLLASMRGHGSAKQVNVMFDIYMKGADSVVDLKNIEANWHLTPQCPRWTRHSADKGNSWGSYYWHVYAPAIKQAA